MFRITSLSFNVLKITYIKAILLVISLFTLVYIFFLFVKYFQYFQFNMLKHNISLIEKNIWLIGSLFIIWCIYMDIFNIYILNISIIIFYVIYKDQNNTSLLYLDSMNNEYSIKEKLSPVYSWLKENKDNWIFFAANNQEFLDNNNHNNNNDNLNNDNNQNDISNPMNNNEIREEILDDDKTVIGDGDKNTSFQTPITEEHSINRWTLDQDLELPLEITEVFTYETAVPQNISRKESESSKSNSSNNQSQSLDNNNNNSNGNISNNGTIINDISDDNSSSSSSSSDNSLSNNETVSNTEIISNNETVSNSNLSSVITEEVLENSNELPTNFWGIVFERIQVYVQENGINNVTLRVYLEAIVETSRETNIDFNNSPFSDEITVMLPIIQGIINHPYQAMIGTGVILSIPSRRLFMYFLTRVRNYYVPSIHTIPRRGIGNFLERARILTPRPPLDAEGMRIHNMEMNRFNNSRQGRLYRRIRGNPLALFGGFVLFNTGVVYYQRQAMWNYIIGLGNRERRINNHGELRRNSNTIESNSSSSSLNNNSSNNDDRNSNNNSSNIITSSNANINNSSNNGGSGSPSNNLSTTNRNTQDKNPKNLGKREFSTFNPKPIKDNKDYFNYFIQIKEEFFKNPEYSVLQIIIPTILVISWKYSLYYITNIFSFQELIIITIVYLFFRLSWYIFQYKYISHFSKIYQYKLEEKDQDKLLNNNIEDYLLSKKYINFFNNLDILRYSTVIILFGILCFYNKINGVILFFVYIWFLLLCIITFNIILYYIDQYIYSKIDKKLNINIADSVYFIHNKIKELSNKDFISDYYSEKLITGDQLKKLSKFERLYIQYFWLAEKLMKLDNGISNDTIRELDSRIIAHFILNWSLFTILFYIWGTFLILEKLRIFDYIIG